MTARVCVAKELAAVPGNGPAEGLRQRLGGEKPDVGDRPDEHQGAARSGDGIGTGAIGEGTEYVGRAGVPNLGEVVGRERSLGVAIKVPPPPTGADCAVGQEGPLWFLPAVPGSHFGTHVTRTCTIPHELAIHLQMASALNDYPCPDPTFQPAPGQSLYDFLISAIRPLFDGETGFEVTLDGVSVVDPLSYRETSDDLFYFKADPSMTAFDPCVTGKRQAAVIDGFYLLFKPLEPGQHVIEIKGHDMHGVQVTLTEDLTVR